MKKRLREKLTSLGSEGINKLAFATLTVMLVGGIAFAGLIGGNTNRNSGYGYGYNTSNQYGYGYGYWTGRHATFGDISANQFVAHINKLVQYRILNGYGDGTIKPLNPTTRAEIAKMVVLANGWNLVNPQTASFSDVPSSHWSYRYVETAKANLAIAGYADGTFKPNQLVIRAEVAKMVAKKFAPNTSGQAFTDVASSHWAYGHVMTCRHNGIIHGFGDNSFRPNLTASRGEAAKMVALLIP